jgi:hypothetical protein
MPVEAARVRRLVVAMLAFTCVGCPAAPERPELPRRAVDKQSLYGDAGLVPTREGERIRRELALAGELHHALEQLGLTGVHVDVELRDPAGVIVVGRADPSADVGQLEVTIDEFARVLVPDVTTVQVRLLQTEIPAEPPAPAPTDARHWLLALACLGLGLSLGVTFERVLARRLIARAR